jgi:hypothetical protein
MIKGTDLKKLQEHRHEWWEVISSYYRWSIRCEPEQAAGTEPGRSFCHTRELRIAL